MVAVVVVGCVAQDSLPGAVDGLSPPERSWGRMWNPGLAPATITVPARGRMVDAAIPDPVADRTTESQ